MDAAIKSSVQSVMAIENYELKIEDSKPMDIKYYGVNSQLSTLNSKLIPFKHQT